MSDDESRKDEPSDDEYIPELFEDEDLAEIASRAMMHADEVKDESHEEAVLMLQLAQAALDARREVRRSNEDLFERVARVLGMNSSFLRGGLGGFLRTCPRSMVEAIEHTLRANQVPVPEWVWAEFKSAREFRNNQEEAEKHNGLKAVPYVPEPENEPEGA